MAVTLTLAVTFFADLWFFGTEIHKRLGAIRKKLGVKILASKLYTPKERDITYVT